MRQHEHYCEGVSALSWLGKPSWASDGIARTCPVIAGRLAGFLRGSCGALAARICHPFPTHPICHPHPYPRENPVKHSTYAIFRNSLPEPIPHPFPTQKPRDRQQRIRQNVGHLATHLRHLRPTLTGATLAHKNAHATCPRDASLKRATPTAACPFS